MAPGYWPREARLIMQDCSVPVLARRQSWIWLWPREARLIVCKTAHHARLQCACSGAQAELEQKVQREKALAEAEGRAREARANEDVNRRTLALRLEEERKKLVEAINTTFGCARAHARCPAAAWSHRHAPTTGSVGQNRKRALPSRPVWLPVRMVPVHVRCKPARLICS